MEVGLHAGGIGAQAGEELEGAHRLSDGHAAAVGDPSRVLACTDCGFDTSAGSSQVAPDVAWEKLRALRAGADLASTRLF